jgi:hypothetical protein
LSGSFSWATFSSTKAAIKIHTLLDLKTSIPEFIFIAEENVHDVDAMNYISIDTLAAHKDEGMGLGWETIGDLDELGDNS